MIIVLLPLPARAQKQIGTSIAGSRCTAPLTGHLVPTTFSGNRIFARWHIEGRGELLLYTDTGGGLVSLFPDAVSRLGLPIDTVRPHRAGASLYLFARIAQIPADSLFPRIPGRDSLVQRPQIEDWDSPPPDEPGITWDGRLGTAWFAGRVWAFDYPHHRLSYGGSAPLGPTESNCWVPLGFQTDSAGQRTTNFPRIPVQVDGEEIQLLLDTGAMTVLTPAALRVVEPTQPRHRATSFIMADRFDEWHARHPDWLMVPDAEEGSDSSAMIRVPEVEVGGQRIGPVWFTKRPNSSFRRFMSKYMDQPVEGALGGSALRYVTLVLDYPRARAAISSEAR